MIMPHSIGVLIPIQTKDSQGRNIINYHPNSPDRIIMGFFQPLKYNIQYKPYGITDQTSDVLYCKDFSITADMHLLFNGIQYRIDSILPYQGHHNEVYLEKVI